LPRINLPPGCGGFKDGERRILAERGPGSFVNLDDGDPQLHKLRNQDYASAGLVDAGPEKFFPDKSKVTEGRWCLDCTRLWFKWSWTCPRCGENTIPESEMVRVPQKIEDYRP